MASQNFSKISHLATMPSHPTIVALAALSALSGAEAAWTVSPGVHAAYISKSAVSTIRMQATAEATAKAAWLAKQDAPAWGGAQAVESSDLSQTTYGTVISTSKSYDPLGVIETQVDAKVAWMSKLDTPTWGNVAVAAPAFQPAPDAGAPVSEVVAKAAWLAKLDAPTWGVGGAPTSEAAAKAAWLAKLDAPVWGGAAIAAPAAASAASFAAVLSSAAAAKAAWMAKLDAPTWGR